MSGARTNSPTFLPLSAPPIACCCPSQPRATASEQIAALQMLLKESESDRAARLEQINTLAKCLKQAEADRAARLEHIENLTNSLKVSEADRAKQSKQRHQLREELAGIYKSRS